MASMKSFHIVVLHGAKVIEDKEKFNAKEANETLKMMQEKYPKEEYPHYAIKKEYY